MPKVLFVATATSHINSFHIPYLKMFKENGYEVHVASNGKESIKYCDKHFNVPFQRFPVKIQNYKPYKIMKEIIRENGYEIIHCNTASASMITRLAAKKVKKEGRRVLYTAHGFHFFKGAPLKNWLIYYPIEKYLSKYTDMLITINHEDYDRIKRKFKKCKSIKYIHGIGLNTSRFNIEITKNELEKLREQIGINENNIILTYVAELNKNKNQILLIKTVEKLIKENDNYRLILVGEGKYKQIYVDYIKKHNLEKYIKLLGYRQDIPQLLRLTNIYVASSLREGLPLNILEAMYSGLPIIATDNRGHRELIKNGKNGFIVKSKNDVKEKIELLEKNKELVSKLTENVKEELKQYELNIVIEEMKKIYNFK